MYHYLTILNKRVRNLAVSKEPWDISEVIRDKQKHSCARTTKEVFFLHGLSRSKNVIHKCVIINKVITLFISHLVDGK